MVEDMCQLVKGEGFKTQVHDFRSFEDTVIFCKKSLPSEAVYHCFCDVGTMLSNIKSGFTMRTEIELREICAAKFQRTTCSLMRSPHFKHKILRFSGSISVTSSRSMTGMAVMASTVFTTPSVCGWKIGFHFSQTPLSICSRCI